MGRSSGVLLGAAADTALTCCVPVPCRGKESRRTTMTLQEPGEEAPAAAGDFQHAVICCLCKSATPINLGGPGGRGGEVLGRWAAGRAPGGRERLVEGRCREMSGRDPAPPGLPQPPAFFGAAPWLPVDVGVSRGCCHLPRFTLFLDTAACGHPESFQEPGPRSAPRSLGVL